MNKNKNNNKLEQSINNDEKNGDGLSQKNTNIKNESSPFEYQTQGGDSRFNKLKLEIINKKQIFPIKIMHYLCILLVCATVILIIYNQTLIRDYFQKIAIFSQENLLFNMTKITIGVFYLHVSDVKLQFHKCFKDNEKHNYTYLYSQLISENIDLLIKIKDSITDIGPQFQEIVEKYYNFELSIYGHNDMEVYKFDLDNILTFFINGGINLLKSYNYLLNAKDLNNLTYGYVEFLDLESQTYLFYQNPSITGFSESQKKKEK